MDGNFLGSEPLTGLRPGLSNEAYQAAAGVSKSKLDAIDPELHSPKHFWQKHINPERKPEERTEALILGDAIHKAILEPDLMESHFVEIPEDAPKRPTKTQLNAKKPSLESQGSITYWADFQAEHAGKTILKPADMEVVIGCRDSVHTNPAVRGFFTGGLAEQSYFAIDKETGGLMKCRVDYDLIEQQAMMVDIKSTEDASERGFGRSATKYRYDVQGAWYPDVVASAYDVDAVQNFVFVAIEKTPPYAIGVYYLEDEERREGLRLARRDFRRILECSAANHWPDFAEAAPPKPLRIRRSS